MDISPERSLSENGGYDRSNEAHADDGKERPKTRAVCFLILSWLCVLVENFDLVAVNIQSLVEWLNHALPHLNMPLDASEEELRAYLIDGTVLCSILNKFCPGLVEMVGFLS